MSTKYVLQPDGSILKIEESPSTTNTDTFVDEGITNISKDIVEENFGESYRKSNFTDIKRVDLDSGEDTLKDNLINYVSSNKSFDFINQSEERELNIPTFNRDLPNQSWFGFPSLELLSSFGTWAGDILNFIYFYALLFTFELFITSVDMYVP